MTCACQSKAATVARGPRHEYPDPWQWRARTCAGLGDQAEPEMRPAVRAPGNAGIEPMARTGGARYPVRTRAVVGFCEENAIDLVVIGPEAPLAAGVADDLRAAGITGIRPLQGRGACWKPPRASPRRSAMPAGRPPPHARASMPQTARAYIRAQGAPIVIKADGLAAGKGVTVAMTEAEALDAIDRCLRRRPSARPAREVVIEEFIDGEEASFFILCDGTDCLPIGTAQDHKRVGDGDTGPNTGGMGASPGPGADAGHSGSGHGRDHRARRWPQHGAARDALSGRALTPG